jgi:hypothetical protein
MKNEGANASLIPFVFNTWAERDPQAALAWATALPEGELRTDKTIGAIELIASRDPLRAIEAAKRTLRTAEDQESALSLIAQRWMRSDLPAMVEWMTRQPEKIQDELLSSVTAEWGRQDPAGAAAWLDQFPKGARRDKAVGAFASAVTPVDPEGAATWAATISDPEQRHSAVENVLNNWGGADKAAAVAWLRSSNAVSPQERTELLRTFDEDH